MTPVRPSRDWCMVQWNTSPIYGKVGMAVGLKSLSQGQNDEANGIAY